MIYNLVENWLNEAGISFERRDKLIVLSWETEGKEVPIAIMLSESGFWLYLFAMIAKEYLPERDDLYEIMLKMNRDRNGVKLAITPEGDYAILAEEMVGKIDKESFLRKLVLIIKTCEALFRLVEAECQ